MRLAIIAASLALAACATTTQQASADLDRGLNAMIGQPVAVAVARLGQPLGTAPVGADRLYAWGQGFQSAELASPSGSFIDAADAQGGVFPPARRPVENGCAIRAVVGADGLIRGWDHQGNARGCRAYVERLSAPALARAG
jgi:hypothetical protein